MCTRDGGIGSCLTHSPARLWRWGIFEPNVKCISEKSRINADLLMPTEIPRCFGPEVRPMFVFSRPH